MKPQNGLPLLTALLALPALSCSFLIGSFEECSKDGDCASKGAGLICTDKMCVDDPDPLKKACSTLVDVDGKVRGIAEAKTGADEAFTFGAIMAMSQPDGSDNPRGQYRSRALGLALSEINQVSVAGRPFRVQVCDHQGDNERVKDLTTYLVDKAQVQAVITGGSSDTIAASAVTIDKQVLLMAISASSPAITVLPDNNLVWRIASSDAQLGEYVAGVIDPSAQAKVGVIHVSDTFGSGLAQVFADSYTSDSVLIPIDADGGNLDQKLGFASGQNLDMLYIIAFSQNAAAIVNQLESRGLPTGDKLFFADSMKDATFLDAVTDPSVIEGARGASPGDPEGPVYEGFASRFEQEYSLNPEDQSYLAHSYDAAYCLALGAAWAVGSGDASSVSSPAIAEGLKHLSDLNATSYEFKPADFANMAAALQAHSDINVRGASGELDFDPDTGEAPSASVLWWIAGGAFSSTPPAGSDAGVRTDAGGADATGMQDAAVREDAGVVEDAG